MRTSFGGVTRGELPNQFADPLFERRTDLVPPQPGEASLQLPLELGARQAAAARVEMPGDVEVRGICQLCIEVGREQSQRLVAGDRPFAHEAAVWLVVRGATRPPSTACAQSACCNNARPRARRERT